MNAETYLKIVEMLNVLPYKTKAFSHEKYIYWQSIQVTLNQFLEKNLVEKILSIAYSNPMEIVDSITCLPMTLLMKVMAIFVTPSNINTTLKKTLTFLENCSCSKDAKLLHEEISGWIEKD